MAIVTKSFDVKIDIKRPYITKNLSNDDFSKIIQTTTLKYESLKTTAPQAATQVDEAEEETGNPLAEAIKETDQIYEEFEDLASQAEKELNSIVLTYDPSLPENELIAEAERNLFGSASGVITFSKYKKVLAYEQIVNRQISENMVENGGTLDVA